MATTETFGGPCPRCEYDRCHIRYGTGTWYRYIACPGCYFAFGMYDDSMPTDGGISSGADVWRGVFRHPSIQSIEDVKELSESATEDIVEDNPVFDFETFSDDLLEASIVSEQTMELLESEEHELPKDV